MQYVRNALLWLDPVLIAPYRWLDAPMAAFLLGTFVLCLWCVILGDAASLGAARLNRKLYAGYLEDMVHHHNLSVKAIGRGDKAGYKAVNRQAHEAFGKYFFSQAAAFSVSIWPVPFALAWLDLRFHTVVFTLPFFDAGVGYTFFFFPLYILTRLVYARVMRRFPAYRRMKRAVSHDDGTEEVMSFRDLDRAAAEQAANKALPRDPEAGP